ncbi:MAG: hypothetical protein ACUVX8_18495 [Candidatus Zipacnadales bacterium]
MNDYYWTELAEKRHPYSTSQILAVKQAICHRLGKQIGSRPFSDLKVVRFTRSVAHGDKGVRK